MMQNPVRHTLGKGEVQSSNLCGGTTSSQQSQSLTDTCKTTSGAIGDCQGPSGSAFRGRFLTRDSLSTALGRPLRCQRRGVISRAIHGIANNLGKLRRSGLLKLLKSCRDVIEKPRKALTITPELPYLPAKSRQWAGAIG